MANSTDRLNGREKEIVLLAAQGLSRKQIAERLGLSIRTIEVYLHIIYRILELPSRSQQLKAAAEEMTCEKSEA